MTMASHRGVGCITKVSLAPAASIAETYFPMLAKWLVSPSSNHLLAHWKNKGVSCENGTNQVCIYWIWHTHFRRSLVFKTSPLLQNVKSQFWQMIILNYRYDGCHFEIKVFSSCFHFRLSALFPTCPDCEMLIRISLTLFFFTILQIRVIPIHPNTSKTISTMINTFNRICFLVLG